MKELVKKIVRGSLGEYMETICCEIDRIGQNLDACKEELTSCSAQVADLRIQISKLEKEVLSFKDKASTGKTAGTSFEENMQMDILYAYRYLLDRDPEDPRIIENNSLDWRQLKEIFLNSPEYKNRTASDWVPSGHFYSPIPDKDTIKEFWAAHPDGYPITDLNGVDLNLKSQYMLCAEFAEGDLMLDDFWPMEKNDGRRYYVNNDFFAISDAIVFFYLIQIYKPKRIIEIGSGFSSAVALDVNQAICNNQIHCTFIEPYPERLYSLLSETDKSSENIKIVESKLQDVDLSVFEELSCGDILFVDSTHVSKFGSDVNYILFQILPCLQKGVLIHFHDISYPFDYPKEWLVEGRSWNEAYMLHSFLQYNDRFSIKFWMPLLLRVNKKRVNFLGKYDYLAHYTCSLWLEKK